MFKIHALVYVLFIGLSVNVHAAEYAGGGDCGKRFEVEINAARGNEAKEDKAREAFNNCMRMSKGSSGTSCEDARPDLQKARGELSAACNAMGLGTGIKECLAKQKECDEFKPSSSASSTKNATEKAKYCPSISEDDDKIQKQLDKAEEKLATAREKLPDLQEKVTSASSEANKSISELRQKERDALSEMNKAIKETKREKDKEISRVQEQMAQIAAQLGQADEQIGQLELSKTDAAMKRDETKIQIDLNCHQTASATVSKLQSDALAKMQTGTYSRGGQASMMKNVGISDRESWQKVAEKYYIWCLRSKPTIDSKTSANRMYTAAIAQADLAIGNARKRKALLETQYNRMKNPDGSCGAATPTADGATGESDMCRATRQMNEDIQQAREEFVNKSRGLNEDMARERQDGGQKVMAAQQALAKANQTITDEQTRVNNLRSVLDARANSPQGGGTREDRGELRKALAKWAGAAQLWDSCCAKEAVTYRQLCTDNGGEMNSAGMPPQWSRGDQVTVQPAADPEVVPTAAESSRPRPQSGSPAQPNTGPTTTPNQTPPRDAPAGR